YAYRVGFPSSRCDSSLFIYQHGSEEFDMTGLGALNYFLGISVTRDSTGMFLSQKKYALKLLQRAHMANCNPTRTPVGTEFKHGSDGDPISDPTLYRSLGGSLVAYIDVDSAGLSGGLHLVIVFSWEIIYSHGQTNGNILSLDRVLKLSTEVLLMCVGVKCSRTKEGALAAQHGSSGWFQSAQKGAFVAWQQPASTRPLGPRHSSPCSSNSGSMPTVARLRKQRLQVAAADCAARCLATWSNGPMVG
ncbi:ribonuclease H-like domain-containing protein, partial [Tanacetum coccineum]